MVFLDTLHFPMGATLGTLFLDSSFLAFRLLQQAIRQITHHRAFLYFRDGFRGRYIAFLSLDIK